jgi:hypothetical protein
VIGLTLMDMTENAGVGVGQRCDARRKSKPSPRESGVSYSAPGSKPRIF